MSVFGKGALVVAGHHVPYALLAAGAGIAGAVLLVVQIRRAGSAGIGQSAMAAGGTYVDAQGNIIDANGNVVGQAQGAGVSGGGGDSGALAGISAQLTDIRNSINTPSGYHPTAPALSWTASGAPALQGFSPIAGSNPYNPAHGTAPSAQYKSGIDIFGFPPTPTPTPPRISGGGLGSSVFGAVKLLSTAPPSTAYVGRAPLAL